MNNTIDKSVAANIINNCFQPKEETKAAASRTPQPRLTTVGRPRFDEHEEKRTERISLVVTPSLYDKIDKASRDNKQTKNNYIITVLEKILGE